LFPIPDLVLEVRNSLAAIASRRDDSTLSDIAYEAFGIRRQERPLLDEWLERRRSLAPADEAEAELEQDDGDYP
jgi:hypothetical protein